MFNKKNWLVILITALILITTACNGRGGGTTPPTPAPDHPTPAFEIVSDLNELVDRYYKNEDLEGKTFQITIPVEAEGIYFGVNYAEIVFEWWGPNAPFRVKLHFNEDEMQGVRSLRGGEKITTRGELRPRPGFRGLTFGFANPVIVKIEK